MSFVFSAIPDGQRAFREMLRVLRPNGTIIILDAGEADNGNKFAYYLAKLWENFGDFIRDERSYMEKAGLSIERQELGPGGCVHIIVGSRKA
jgi:ubiquinone/menaquinone biosynthesis C-methylase UbiE